VTGRKASGGEEGESVPSRYLSTRLIYAPIPAKILDIVMLFPFPLGWILSGYDRDGGYE
jgi:hypothetical protein